MDRALEAQGRLDRRARTLRAWRARCGHLPADLTMSLAAAEVELGHMARAEALLPHVPHEHRAALAAQLQATAAVTPQAAMAAGDAALAAGRHREARQHFDRSLAAYERLVGRPAAAELLAARSAAHRSRRSVGAFDAVQVTRVTDGSIGWLLAEARTGFGHLVMTQATAPLSFTVANDARIALLSAAGPSWFVSPQFPSLATRTTVSDVMVLDGSLFGLNETGAWAALDAETYAETDELVRAPGSRLLARDAEGRGLVLIQRVHPADGAVSTEVDRITVLNLPTRRVTRVELPRPPAAADPVVVFDEIRSRVLLSSKAGVVHIVPLDVGSATKVGKYLHPGPDDSQQTLDMAVTEDGRFACVRHGWAASAGARANTCESELVSLSPGKHAGAPWDTWSTCSMRDGRATVVTIPWRREGIGAPPVQRRAGAGRRLLTGASGAFTSICGVAVSPSASHVALLEVKDRSDGLIEDVDLLVLDAARRLRHRVRLLDGATHGGYAQLSFDGDEALHVRAWGEPLVVDLASGRVEARETAPREPAQPSSAPASTPAEPAHVCDVPAAAVERASLLPGGEWLVSGEGESARWSLAEGTVVRELTTTGPAFPSPSSRFLATADERFIRVTDLSNGTERTLRRANALVAVSSRGWLALATGQDEGLALWEPIEGAFREVARVTGAEMPGRIDAASFSPDGTQITTVEFGEARTYRWSGGRRTLRLSWSAPVGSLAIAHSPTGTRVVVGAQVFRGEDGRRIATLAIGRDERIVDVAMDGAGRVLMLLEHTTNGMAVALFDESGGARLAERPVPRAAQARFTEGGAVVAASRDGRAWTFDRLLRERRTIIAVGPRAAISFDEQGGEVEALGNASLDTWMRCAFGGAGASLITPWRVCSDRFTAISAAATRSLR